MAAAARLNPADARVPCPLCGNLIHPIAGRCKYCKGDLNAGRPQRAAAAGALPALVAVPAQPQPYAPVPPPAPASFAPVPAATPPAGVALGAPQRESQQVLPPRPTGRMHAAKRPSLWKSWPMIVIAIASLAIIAAVAMMVWPDDEAAPKQNALEPPPAPIRMDTEHGRPLPPSATPGGPQGAAPPPAGGSDPWSGGAAPSAPDPDDVDTIDPPPAPDPYAQPTPRDPLKNPFKDFDKIAKDMACDSAKQVKDLASAQCPAASSCFEKFESMACGPTTAADLQDPAKMQSLFLDCMKAVNC